MADHHAPMANEDTDTMDAEAPRNTIEDHMQTYEGFLWLTKWGIAFIVVLLILMAWFLV